MRRAFSFGSAFLLLLSISCSAPSVRQTSGTFTKNVSFSILQDYQKGEDLNEVAADFALFRELGVSTWRGSFSWIDYEPSRGVYDFEWLHRFADLASNNGIALRPYLGYTPQWAAAPGGRDNEFWNNPPARISDWYEFVFHIVSAIGRHANVLSFEIYNEENARMWWDGSPKEYGEVLKSGSNAIHAANPGKQVLFGGMTYPDAGWVKDLCGAFGTGGSFDVLPFHAYPETWTSENIVVENYLDQGSPHYFHGFFLPEADKDCGKKPIWINEMGFATTPGKKTEKDQANWWVRAVATFCSDPRVEYLGIYQIRDREKTAAVIGAVENYYLGLTYPDGRKKLAFNTVKMLVTLLNTGNITVADSELDVKVASGKKGGLYSHLFIRPDKRQIVFAWDRSGSPTLDLKLARHGSRAIEYALDGTTAPYPDFDGQFLRKVRLSAGEVRIFEIRP